MYCWKQELKLHAIGGLKIKSEFLKMQYPYDIICPRYKRISTLLHRIAADYDVIISYHNRNFIINSIN